MMRQRTDIEPLEARIAPASLIDARTIAFTDIDGDEVKIVFSKDVFVGTETAQLTKANEVFKFSTGDVAHEVATQQQLQLIDFTKFPTSAATGSSMNGVGMTIIATQKDGGNGLVDVGAIKATGVSVGKLVIDGDLGQIDAGGASLKVGIASLTVDSIGKRGTSTQIQVVLPTSDNPGPDLISTITGELTALNVLGDVKDARVRVIDGKSGTTVTSAAKIVNVTIGGSLIGRTAVETASDDTGVIECDRTIGTVKIGTTATQGIIGGGGANSGRISAGATIANVTIAGSLTGGGGANSGTITSSGTIAALSIGGDLAGGSGASSGLVRSYGNITSLTIGDDLIAGTGAGSGFVRALGSISKLVIKGDVDAVSTAGSGAGSAGVFANTLPLVTVNGSILGGAGSGSAVIESARTIGATVAATATTPEVTTGITVGGNIAGGVGDGSGAIIADGMLKLASIKGHLTGGSGKQSGVIRSGTDTFQTGDIRKISVAGGIAGGIGDSSGSIIAGGVLGSVSLGSVLAPTADVLEGGDGNFSGTISAHGRIGTVKVIGNVVGGNGSQSGALLSYERSAPEGDLPGSIGTVSISGSLTGGGGSESGRIRADGALAALTVGSWAGGTGAGSGTLVTGAGLLGDGNSGAIRILGDLTKAAATPGAGSVDFLIGGKLKSFFVGGDTTSATLRVAEDVASLNFIGEVTGSKVTALGQELHTATTDVAIGKLTVGGSVVGSSFLAGYNVSGVGANPDAQIGAVSVIGNWSNSNLVAGVIEGTDVGFGNALDVKASGDDTATIVSKIASVVIGGSVTAVSGGQHFGFVAQLVGKMKVGSTVYALNATGGQVFDVSDGVSIREVAIV